MPSIFPDKPSILPAKAIALALLDGVDREALRRAAEHADGWRAFWQSTEATPQEIAAEMGTSAASFFAIASINAQHIVGVGRVVGLSPTELMPPECYTHPELVTINQDGTVKIGEG